jgi:hypothetical protein
MSPIKLYYFDVRGRGEVSDGEMTFLRTYSSLLVLFLLIHLTRLSTDLQAIKIVLSLKGVAFEVGAWKGILRESQIL